MTFGPDTLVVGTLDDTLLNREITLAIGQNRQDMNWINRTGPFGDVVQAMTTFQRGGKDGLCFLQGELVGSRRIGKSMRRNFIMSVDVDTGYSVEDVGKRIVQKGLFAIIYTTHSFGKASTEIAEEHYLRWMKKTGRVLPKPDDHAAVLASLMIYLIQERRYNPTLLNEATYGGRTLNEGGMTYTVFHAPMPKLRVVFLLERPFEFTEGASQKTRIDEWRSLYVAVCRWLDVPFDSSCTDVSRLFYSPRIPHNAVIGEGQHEAIVFGGKALDLEAIGSAASPGASASGGGSGDEGLDALVSHLEDAPSDKPKHTFQTKGLVAFAKNCPDFDVLGFMESMFPDDKRGQGTDPDKAEWACPNEESHTKQSATDRGFFVAVSETTDGNPYWHAQCLHDGCKHASGDDRLWYLDLLCQKAGITSASELEAWSASAQQKQKEASVNSQQVEDGSYQVRIDALSELSTPAEIQMVLRLIATIPDELAKEVALSDVKRKTKGKIPLNAMRKALIIYLQDHMKALGQDTTPVIAADPRTPEPDDPDKASDIWDHWSFAKRFHVYRSLLRRANEEDPRIFLTQDKRIVYVQSTELGAKLVDVTLPILTWHSLDRVQYKILDRMTGDTIEDRVPRDLMETLLGDLEAKWPTLIRISNTPIVLANGKQIHERGYIPEIKMFLDPPEGFLPLPDTITDADIDEAYWTILDAIRDFPFCDYTDADADKPIMSDELDADGHPYPNLDRGRASRAHTIAMIIEPFARHFINGAAPMYFIDKPAPGSGAGYLADVGFISTTGSRAVAQTMSDSNEEFRKAITAVLREGSPIVFVDNVNRKVDSGPLAAAITNGVWQDRILGESVVTKIKIENTWLIAGNNVEFTSENMRRLVPIKLDARVPNPAFDRPKTAFKHNPLQDYLVENRPEIVRSINILVKNWVDKGMLRSNLTFNSFDNWIAVMGGILEAAGITGMLGSLKDFNEIRNTDDDTKNEYGVMMFDRYKFEHFSKGEALLALKGSGFGTSVELPIKADKDDSVTSTELRKWMLKYMAGNTFYLDDGKTELVTLAPHRTKNDRTGWQFKAVKGFENMNKEK